MAAIALSISSSPINPFGRPGGTSLLARAQGLLGTALDDALSPLMQHERLYLAAGGLAASPDLAERAAQDGFPSARSLLRFLGAAVSLRDRAGELSSQLAGLLPEAAGASGSAVFLSAVRSSTGGTPQENVGRTLLADARHQAKNGISQVTLQVNGGPEYVVRVAVGSGDTNRDVLQRLAGAINRAQPDARADVQEASAGGVTLARLRIAAERPGVGNRFTLSDRVGDLVAYTRAGNVATAPSDVQTGGETRQDAVARPALERLSDGTHAAATAIVGQTVDALNRFVAEAVTIPLPPERAAQLDQAIGEALRPLASAGIVVEDDGTLAVTGWMLEAALTDREAVASTVGALVELGTHLGELAADFLAQPPTTLVAPEAQGANALPPGTAATPFAPVASLLRRYRLSQEQADSSVLSALRFGGLVINQSL